MRRNVLAVGLAGLAAGVAALVLTLESDHATAPVAHGLLNALLIWSFTAGGLTAWVRPRSP